MATKKYLLFFVISEKKKINSKSATFVFFLDHRKIASFGAFLNNIIF